MLKNHTQCYKHAWIVREVFKASESVAGKLSNTERLESEILEYVGAYLVQDASNANHRSYIRRMIYGKVSNAIKRNRKEHATIFSSLEYDDEDGDSQEYEPADPLARAGSDKLELKETIDMLAHNDRRRELILNAWTNGTFNDTEISRGLASALGGATSGHLSFIKRFRNECRRTLKTAI